MDILEIDSRSTCTWGKCSTTESRVLSFNLHIFFFLLSKRKLNIVLEYLLLAFCIVVPAFFPFKKRKDAVKTLGLKTAKTSQTIVQYLQEKIHRENTVSKWVVISGGRGESCFLKSIQSNKLNSTQELKIEFSSTLQSSLEACSAGIELGSHSPSYIFSPCTLD